MDEERLIKIGKKAQELEILREMPEWKRLGKILDDRMVEHKRMLLHRIMSPHPVDQREIDFYRGFWTGCKWLLDTPDASDRSLKTALRQSRLGTTEEGE